MIWLALGSFLLCAVAVALEPELFDDVGHERADALAPGQPVPFHASGVTQS